MNCLCFNVNTFGIPMCAQRPLTYSLWEGPEDDWITVETCSPIVISENKCCADVKKILIYLYVEVQLLSRLSSALHRGEMLTSRPGSFTAGKERRYSLNRILGGPQSRRGHFWRRENALPLPGFVSRTVQFVASRYIDHGAVTIKYVSNWRLWNEVSYIKPHNNVYWDTAT